MNSKADKNETKRSITPKAGVPFDSFREKLLRGRIGKARPMTILINAVTLISLMALCLVRSQASEIKVDISSSVTHDIRTWTGGTNYPPGGFITNVAGVSFYVAGFPGSSNGLGIVATGIGTVAGPVTNDFPVNVTNAVTVYTLLNSTVGEYGYTNGTIDFYGSQGAHASFDLVQGVNIRDHYNGYFNNIVSSNIMSLFFGPAGEDRFDGQGWMLPPDFFSQLLTNVQIRSFGNNPHGIATLVAITVRTSAPDLTIKTSGAQAACYWPSTPTNLILQTATSLQNPNWTNVTSSAFVTNNQFVVVNAMTDPQRFYRLMSVP
jgi:hypothetical protein